MAQNNMTAPDMAPADAETPVPGRFSDISVEAVKAYWNSRPCNIRHSTSPIGTREYFDEVEARKYLVEPHIPGFAQFDRWKGKRVLEIGCGLGTDTTNFARAGADVTACDLSIESIKLAEKRAEVFGLSDRIKFQQVNAEHLSEALSAPPAGEAYDLIYSFGVIHHSPHPERIVAEMRKFLKPGGKLKLMVYYRFSWKVLWIWLTERKNAPQMNLEQLVARSSEAQTGCPVTYIYSKAQGRKLVEDHGFRATKITVDHIFPYRIADYVKYQYVREWYWRWMPRPMFRAFERLFGWHLLIEAEAV